MTQVSSKENIMKQKAKSALQNEKSSEKMETLFLTGICILAIAGVGYTICTQTFWFYDIEIYWKNMSGLFTGDTEKMTLLMPWGRLLGQLMCPGFLPLKVCMVYFYLLLLAGTVILGKFIYDYLQQKQMFHSRRNAVIAATAVCMLPFYWHDVLNTGNVGGMICLLLMLTAFLVEKHPYLSGFLLAAAMTKPQNAGIFLAILFFRKNYKTVFSAAGFCGISWGISSLILHLMNGPVQGVGSATATESSGKGTIAAIISRFSKLGVENDKYSFFTYGIFDPLVDFGVPTMVVLLLSALFGVVLVLVFCLWMKKYPVLQKDPVVYFAFCSVVSVLWCYKSPCDEIVMILSSLMAIYYWHLSEKKITDVLLALAAMFAFNGKVFRFWGAHILNLQHGTTVFGDQVLRLIVILVLFVLITRKLRNNQEN